MGEDLRHHGVAKVIWEPQPRQAEAISCPAFELFFGGAKGGGKSDFLIGDYLSDYEEWGESWKGVVFRRTYKELDEFLSRSKEVIGQIPGARFVGGDQYQWYIPAPYAKYPGYATLKLRVIEKYEDVGKYNGHQYPWLAWDELTEHPTGDAYIFMLGCCRSPHGAPARVRATGNPGRPGHVWVKDRFIDVAASYQFFIDPSSGLARCFIPSRLEDNQILMRQDPEYEKRLLLQPAHLIKALRYGSWDVIAGQVLSEFTREKHVVKMQPLAQGWYKFAAMDWGYSKPFSIGWYAVNTDGRLVRYKEWYGSTGKPNEGLKMGTKEVAARAWEMGVFDGVDTLVADPACWSKTNADAPAIIDAFQDVGFTCVPGINDRKTGLIKLHDMMKAEAIDGRGMFVVMENCRQWLRTVPFLTANPRDPEDIDTRLEDHAYDETRYAVMSDFVSDPRSLLIKSPLDTVSAARTHQTARQKPTAYDELRNYI